MENNTEYNDLLDQLRQLGFDENRINKVLDLALEEMFDTAMEDLEISENISNIDKIKEISQKPLVNPTDGIERMNEIFTIIYGEESEKKRYDFLVQYLKNIIDITKKAKEVMNKYNMGDPDTIQQVNNKLNTQEVQDILSSNK